jgi:hypothetical protein
MPKHIHVKEQYVSYPQIKKKHTSWCNLMLKFSDNHLIPSVFLFMKIFSFRILKRLPIIYIEAKPEIASVVDR